MTAMDLPGFLSAFGQFVAAYGRDVDQAQAQAYFAYLQPHSLDAVREGFRGAALKGGRYLPTVGEVVEAITDARGLGAAAQAREDKPRCPDCDGKGFLAVVTATRQVLSHDELREWERTARPRTPRADGRPHHAMAPCGTCKPHRLGAVHRTARAIA